MVQTPTVTVHTAPCLYCLPSFESGLKTPQIILMPW